MIAQKDQINLKDEKDLQDEKDDKPLWLICGKQLFNPEPDETRDLNSFEIVKEGEDAYLIIKIKLASIHSSEATAGSPKERDDKLKYAATRVDGKNIFGNVASVFISKVDVDKPNNEPCMIKFEALVSPKVPHTVG